MKIKIIVALVIVGLIALFSSAFVVDETQQVVITQFGKAVGEPITKPGLYFKLPIVQKANYFPKNLLEWDGDPGQIPTLDKTYIWVDTFARWKIVDPLKFFQTVNNVMGAQARLDDILDAAVRNLVTSHRLIETVRKSNRTLDTLELGLATQEKYEMLSTVKVGRAKIMEEVKRQAEPKVEQFGISLVDVKIKRVNYVEQVRKSVYARMIAERRQMAEKFRSEGQGEARKIEGEKEKVLKKITSEAYMKAQIIKGKADAEATRIYAEAFGKDPEFYSFLKTLEVYRSTMDKDSTLVLSTKSDFLRYLKGYEKMGNP
ncbi:MAG: protease modulator HflC [Deltaproteobacteria bacterium]|nr:MAG: protease modulator HflC [Deltaproteobacteria bacterium]HDG98434.1 protease modulator HflC [Desulfobacterales bacterium]